MKQISRISLYIVALACCAATVAAQKAERKNVREGNKLYTNEKYTESEIAYRKSLEVNPRSMEGTFNLGNALYKQKKFPEAAEQYQLIAGQTEKLVNDDPRNKDRLAEVFHNMGNISMNGKEYAKSVEAYKQSLRLNPHDDETRYNLALAQKLLEDQQNQQQDQQQQQDDQKQDQQDQQQQQQQQDQKQDKTQEEQQQNEQMSQDNAQQMLDALLQDEKDTQEKVKKAQAQQQQSRKKEKEW